MRGRRYSSMNLEMSSNAHLIIQLQVASNDGNARRHILVGL